MDPRPPAIPPHLESGRLDSQVLEKALALSGHEQSSFVFSFYKDDPEAAGGMLRFLSRMGQLGSFLNQSPMRLDRPPEQFQIGELLENRFEVLSLAGLGGMGKVYRVADKLSGDILALKVCRDCLELPRNELDLLRDETWYARRISHPNVCRIHELFATQRRGKTTVFFTMEWLEGETLAQYLSNSSPLPADETVSIAVQLAAGLDAVHRARIVHRDLKPGNILLVPEPDGSKRAVITDFGLACRVSTNPRNDNSESSPDGLIGTLDYMAPEQLLENTMTSATDVYALALIVFEMAAGSKPYGDADFLRVLLRRVSEDYPAAAIAHGLPERWRHPLARALKKEPSERYQSAGAFVADLRDRQAGPPAGLHAHKPSRRTVLGISAALAASVASGFAFLRLQDLRPFNGRRPLLMLTPITYSSGQKDSGAFARTAETLLRMQLNESAYVTVLSRDQMESAWKRTGSVTPSVRLPEFLDPQTARYIALRSGSPYVLYGNLGQTGDERLLRLRLELLEESVLAPQRSRSREFALREDRDLLDAVHDAAAWVRVTVGESKASLAAHFSRPEELTTPSWSALKEYTAGDLEWRAARPGPAILHLKTALAIDDQFAAACTRLADIFMANGQPDDAYLQYAAAAKMLAARNLTDRESLLGRGLFALDVGLSQDADDIFARYILEYPADPLPKFYRAAALDMLDRPEEAHSLLSQAIKLSPSTYSFVMGRARHYLEQGKLNEAQKDWERARAIERNDWTDQAAMAIAFARHDISSAGRAIARMRATGSLEFQSKSFALEACLLSEQGRWPEAEAVLKQGLSFDRRSGASLSALSTKQRMLCQIHLSQGNKNLAACIGLNALRQAPGQEARLQIACVLAQAGGFPPRRDDICAILDATSPEQNACASEPDSLDPSVHPLVRANCATATLPPWPIYQYWKRRLEVELSLTRKRPAQAIQIASTVPDPPIRHIFPDHLLRIANAANDRSLKQSLLRLLTSQLGRWWLEPERNSPGFVQAATKTISQ